MKLARRDKAVYTILAAILMFAVWLNHKADELSAATYTIPPATFPDGSAFSGGTFTTPASTQPVIPPPVVTPPVNPNPSVTQPTTNPGAVIYPTSPGIAQNEIDRWIASFPHDAAGFIDFDAIMAVRVNPVFVSTSTTPGHLASDLATINAAQEAAIANGSYFVGVLRGDPSLDNTVFNNGLCGFVGTPAKPFILCSVGPSHRYHDFTYPRPTVNATISVAGSPNNGKSYGGPIHGLIIGGFDIHYLPGDPSSATFVKKNQSANVDGFRLVDTSPAWGASSDHILLTDTRIRYFTKGVEIQSQSSYPMLDVGLFRCVIDHNYGWRFGGYDYHTQDFLIAESILDHNGWNETALPKTVASSADFPQGMIHNWYTGLNPTTETNDPQHRYVYDIVARAAADGIQGNAGGMLADDYFISNPRDGYTGAGYASQIFGNVCEGGGAEFDQGAPSSALALDASNIAATSRGNGLFSDCAKPTAIISGNLFINHPDKINSGAAIGVYTQDNPKGMTAFATAATISGNSISGWNIWSADGKADGPNTVQLTPPPSPTTIYANDNFPGVFGIPGINGNAVNWADGTRDMDSFAKALNIPGVNDAMDFLNAADANWSGNYDPRLTAAALETYVELGWVPISVQP